MDLVFFSYSMVIKTRDISIAIPHHPSHRGWCNFSHHFTNGERSQRQFVARPRAEFSAAISAPPTTFAA